jgi:ribosomal protein S18 acetylase RimI-like enzyme
MINRSSWLKITGLVLGIALLGGGVYYYQKSSLILVQDSRISPYDEARDTQEILDIFKENWYWLISSPDYSPEFMLSQRAPNNREPEYFGKLKIDVLRDHGKLVGFVTYYLKNPFEGWILFLAVKEEYRGKGYAKALMKHALNQLKKMGALKAHLLTRINNTNAQSLYRSLGFTTMFEDDEGFIYFEKPLH